MTFCPVPRGDPLRGALDCDDRQMSAVTVRADTEIECDPGLTSNECLRPSAWRTTRPPFRSAAPGLQDADGCGPRREWRRRVASEAGGRCTRRGRAPVPG